jgi:hypothetical protein
MAPRASIAFRTLATLWELRLSMRQCRVARGWGQHLLDIGAEDLAVDRPVQDVGSGDPVVARGGQEGAGLPTAMRDAGDQALAARGPTVPACHVPPAYHDAPDHGGYCYQ